MREPWYQLCQEKMEFMTEISMFNTPKEVLMSEVIVLLQCLSLCLDRTTLRRLTVIVPAM
jgi:hypothetical protein